MSEKPNLINKTEVARRLHEMVDERLFGNKPWPVEEENTKIVHGTMLELGLIECVPGVPQTFRTTTLGAELHANLLEAFMGLWDEFELPDRTFKAYVRRAYSAYYNPTRSLN